MQNSRNLPSQSGRRNGGGNVPFRAGSDWEGGAWPAADPLGWLLQMQDEMDRAMRRFLPQSANGEAGAWRAFTPKIDVAEDDNEYCIEADLPGVKQDDIRVEVRNGMLNLRAEMRQEPSAEHSGQKGEAKDEKAKSQSSAEGSVGKSGDAAPQNGQASRKYHLRERQYGYLERSFALPEDVDAENIRADFKDAVLTLHLPKQESQKAAARQISIGQTAAMDDKSQGPKEPQSQSLDQ